MRFQCLEVTCGKPFGWTAKKIVHMVDPEYELPITYEYVVCPYCGGLNFDEYRNGAPSKPVAAKPVPPIRYPAPVTSQPTQGTSQFDPADLMQHSWKGKKIGKGQWATGTIDYGWDFKDQFKSETVQELEIQGTIEISGHNFQINGGIVSAKKAKQ